MINVLAGLQGVSLLQEGSPWLTDIQQYTCIQFEQAVQAVPGPLRGTHSCTMLLSHPQHPEQALPGIRLGCRAILDDPANPALSQQSAPGRQDWW